MVATATAQPSGSRSRTASASASASTATESVVRVQCLTKVFKDFWGRPKARAVDDVTFEVRRGEVFGLLGPNGSGKSTTVKLLLGLLHPTRGRIEVFGHSPRHVATKSRIGYLPEESYLYRYLDSTETIDFFGNLFHLPAKDRQQRTEQLLEMVGLSQVRRRTVGEFSKGMQRRIGLAQALINDPDLIILDEPTSGLDPIGCREVKDLIVALARRGKTVILSSHLLADVEDVCDRVVIYYGGRVRAIGPLKELLASPDAVRITTPPVGRETMEEVLAKLRAAAGGREVRVETPTQNLESYFLGVVEEAKRTEATSGATSGAQVAAYLRGDAAEGAERATDRVLERLTRVEAEPERRGEAKAPEPGAAAGAGADLEKLDALTQETEESEEESRPESGTAKPGRPDKPDLSGADDKLSHLLGGGGGGGGESKHG